MQISGKIAAMAAVFLLSGTASAVGTVADVTVYDRIENRVLPVYRHDGRYYVVGKPGNEYQIRVRNRGGADILAVMAVDGVTVTAEAPLLDADAIKSGSTVRQEELERVPSARDPWVVLEKTPGVLTDRLNVGGNESGQQSFNRAGTAIEVKPSLQPAPGSTEFLFTGALPPREIGVELEIKEKKAKRR